ncbi:UDP-glucuronosyltransferase 2A3-like [Vombatus ursinus]|uniref:UDP-glucuronosyltransferase 2A3-like n=1 Tax=Vombatus ursinus TaxID=29139 RepID=UPI000FFD76E5|nr:UDP-glucuronosyltransferase 2A3-like [Vombatus ursinus]
MFEKWVSVLLLLQFCCFGCGSCGKVLAWPLEYSHWINMKIVLEELAQRGNMVTVLVPSATILIDPTDSSSLNYEAFPVSATEEEVRSKMETFLDEMVNQNNDFSQWKTMWKFHEMMGKFMTEMKSLCEAVVFNQTLMEKLQKTGYDVLFADAVFPCGDLIAEMLEIPFINSLRWSMGNTYEKFYGGLPSPLSYVPMPMGKLTDKMTFMERVKNMLLSLLSDYYLHLYDIIWEQFYSEALVLSAKVIIVAFFPLT